MSIVYENKDGSRTAVSASKKKKSRKGATVGIAAGVVGLAVLAGVGGYLYFGRHNSVSAFDTPEGVAQAAAECTIAKDMDGLFNLQSEKFQQRSMSDVRLTYSLEADDRAETVKVYQRDFDEGVYPVLLGHYGDTVRVTYDVGKYASYGDDNLSDIELPYRMQGVDDEFTCDDAGVVPVTLHLESDNGIEPMDSELLVPVIEIDGEWTLAQCTTEHYINQVPEYTAGEPWMDILDGFHIVGEFDSDSKRVFRQQEDTDIIPMSTQIFQEKDGNKTKWYYEDNFRNKVYVDVEVTDPLYGQVMATPNGKVTGPDGGEALTADTYEEYWNAFYEEENRKWLEEHPEAAEQMKELEEQHSHGSVSGNAISTQVPDVVQPDGVTDGTEE